MKLRVFIVLLSITISLAVECNATNYQFFSTYSLGIQNELNVTFEKIQQTLTPIPIVQYQYSSNYKYSVLNFKPIFTYLDSRQKAVVQGNDTVLISGGRLKLDFTFDWKLTGLFNKTGTASGIGLGDEIIFSKILVSNSEGFLQFSLKSSYNITFLQNINITRIDPFAEDDQQILTKMLNTLINVTTVKDHLTNHINLLYPTILNSSLHDQQYKLQRYRNYTWVDDYGQNITITYQHFLLSCDLEPQGMNLLFVNVIKDYDNFQCGKTVPHQPKNISYYGGTQEFLSIGVYYSSVLYALQRGFFHTDLNQDKWESKYFQFRAGDLYDAIPALTKKFVPSQKLVGNCVAQTNQFNLTKGGYDFFNVSMSFVCNIGTQRAKIIDFNLKALFQVQGVALSTSVDFVIKNAYFTPTYSTYLDNVVENTVYADYLVQSSVQSLIGKKVFGSGYGAFTRDYPRFMIEQDYTVIFDFSHISEGSLD